MFIEPWGNINFYPTNGLNPYTGYGRLELGLAGAMQAEGVGLKLRPERGLPTLVTGGANWLTAPHIAGTRRYMYTQSESTRVSQEWVNLLNWHAHAVFVTNPALIEIYRASGVTRPVICAGHGVELTLPTVAPGWDGESRFEWLAYSYGDLRKGAELSIMAFKYLFHGNHGHHLTIKARDGAEATWLRGIAKGNDPQITVVFGQQDEADWMGLIKRSHAFLFPSRAEGFGMPPRETTLAGLPTIATEWLGMADVKRWGLPIRIKDMRVATYDVYAANAKDAQWAEPDMDHLKEQMLWVYENYSAAREIALAGGWYIRDNNTWRGVARTMLATMGVW